MDPVQDRPSEPLDPDLTGRQLGDFRLLRRLGQGAMAEVYLAEQCSLRRQVAVKVLKARLAADATYVKRFQREAQAAAALVHANIVQIHEVGQVDGLYYIAQEYVQGLNLRQWMARNGAPDLPLALLIMRQVAAALAKAADAGIVHRDIKPENIMLTRTGEVKVADFGLARMLRTEEGTDLTQVGVTLGTPLYMSPEQVEGKPLDPRSDIYSFGVTCYQMLAGGPPFSGDTALSLALQHLKKQPEPLENHRPDLPAALCRIVHKMLAKSPEHRYQSPQELLRELRKVQPAGSDEQWPEDLPGCEADEMAATLRARNETTQRLDALMKTAPPATPGVTRWVGWLAAALAAGVLGGILAWRVTRVPFLLADVSQTPAVVPKQETVFRQWLYASQLGTEEAWRSVLDYYPDKPYWVNRAKQQLARIYLREGNNPKAMEIFDELATLDDTEVELRAWAMAGKCGLLAMEGKYREAAAILDQLLPIRDKLQDSLMRQMLNYAVRTIRTKLGPHTAQQWREWLAEQFRDSS
ncbi:MAG: serine/threonine protein kinase [Thermoguttaceae bacterium]|jgi:serine/threonine-protein kinase|nr:serine/threonine protein kinase [Thermoguttaceae bacterium]